MKIFSVLVMTIVVLFSCGQEEKRSAADPVAPEVPAQPKANLHDEDPAEWFALQNPPYRFTSHILSDNRSVLIKGYKDEKLVFRYVLRTIIFDGKDLANLEGTRIIGFSIKPVDDDTFEAIGGLRGKGVNWIIETIQLDRN